MKNFYFFFQHYIPFPGAAARRASSILENYNYENERITLITTTEISEPKKFNTAIFSSDKAGNKRSLWLRAISEFVLGLKVAIFVVTRPKIDGFVISIPTYLASIPIAISLWIRGIPYVVEARDVYPETFAEAKIISENSLVYKLFKIFSKKLYTQSLGVIVPTNGVKNFIADYVGLDKIKLIENGFAERKICQRKYKKFTVCFHGVLGEFQDVVGLIELAKILKKNGDIDFIVIGYGKKETLLKDAEGITFLGRKPPEQTLEIIERCHFGVSLRTNDRISKNAFPVKIWEYIGMSIPCIVTPISEAGDFLQSNGLGAQYSYGDYENIAKKILEFKNGEWKIEQEGSLQKFSRKNTGRAAAEVIHNFFKQETTK